MIKYLVLFISLVKGCFIDIKNNTLIKENCFIEINNKNNYGHNYILELPIKENNLIKFDWHNLNSLVNIKLIELIRASRSNKKYYKIKNIKKFYIICGLL